MKKFFLIFLFFSCSFAEISNPYCYNLYKKNDNVIEIKDINENKYLIEKKNFQNTIRHTLKDYNDNELIHSDTLFIKEGTVSYIYSDKKQLIGTMIEKNNSWFSPKTFNIEKNGSTILSADESYWGTKLIIYDENKYQIALLYRPWIGVLDNNWSIIFKDYWAWNTDVHNDKNKLYMILLISSYQIDSEYVEKFKDSIKNEFLEKKE